MTAKELMNYYAMEGIRVERALERLTNEFRGKEGRGTEMFCMIYDQLEADLDKCDTLNHLFHDIAYS